MFPVARIGKDHDQIRIQQEDGQGDVLEDLFVKLVEVEDFLEELGIVRHPGDLVGQDLEGGEVVFVEDIRFLALYVEGADDPFSELDGHTEFGARVFFLGKGDDTPGFVQHVVGQQGLARSDDGADDAHADLLMVALGQVGLIRPCPCPQDHLVGFPFCQEERGMVIIEALLHRADNPAKDFVRVERGESHMRHLVDGGKMGGPLAFGVEQPGDLPVALPEVVFRLHLIADVGDHGKAADVVAPIVPEGGARDPDGDAPPVFVGDFKFVGGGLAAPPPGELGLETFLAFGRIDRRDVLADDFIPAVAGDLLHAMIEEEDGFGGIHGRKPFVHRFQKGLEVFLGMFEGAVAFVFLLLDLLVAHLVVEFGDAQEEFVHGRFGVAAEGKASVWPICTGLSEALQEGIFKGELKAAGGIRGKGGDGPRLNVVPEGRVITGAGGLFADEGEKFLQDLPRYVRGDVFPDLEQRRIFDASEPGVQKSLPVGVEELDDFWKEIVPGRADSGVRVGMVFCFFHRGLLERRARFQG